MSLQDQFAAEPVLVVDYDDVDVIPGEFERGGYPCGPPTDYENVSLNRLDGLEPDGRPVVSRQLGHIGAGRDLHSLPNRHHASFDRHAVGYDHALGALAVGAEDSLSAAVLVMMAEYPYAVGKQRR